MFLLQIAFYVGVQVEEGSKSDSRGLSPEMMQLGAVGAVKVAVRSLSMGVGPSKSQKPYFSVLSLVYYYLIRCKGNVHDYASNCHQSFECYQFPYSSFVVSTIFYILTVSIQVEVRSSTCVSWVLVHSIYFPLALCVVIIFIMRPLLQQ